MFGGRIKFVHDIIRSVLSSYHFVATPIADDAARESAKHTNPPQKGGDLRSKGARLTPPRGEACLVWCERMWLGLTRLLPRTAISPCSPPAHQHHDHAACLCPVDAPRRRRAVDLQSAPQKGGGREARQLNKNAALGGKTQTEVGVRWMSAKEGTTKEGRI